MKKQIMSIAAAAALFTTGAMAFDYTYGGEILTNVTNATEDANGNPISQAYATYIGGIEANADLNLSTNNKGDALIYPAFRFGTFTPKGSEQTSGPWSSTMVVRNAEANATVCKVVLYAEDNSRELMDFNIYLSPYDAFRFTIEEDGTVTTRDGSFTKIHKNLQDDEHQFVNHEQETLTIGKINKSDENKDVTAGYAVIYAMVEATNTKLQGTDTTTTVSSSNAYHGDHGKLFEDFRLTMDICRDYNGTAYDYNLSNNSMSGRAVNNWRNVLNANASSIVNGTGTESNVTAPNVESACLTNAIATNAAANDDNGTLNKIANMTSLFTSPSSDLLFGDITISTGGEDPRNLLIHATALDNYTADNQMMLWADGEYAAIQDRRITDNTQNIDSTTALSGFGLTDRAGYSDYNVSGIRNDALTFMTKQVYYTFDKNEMKGANTLLVTQPMKRAVIMANDVATTKYWSNTNVPVAPYNNKWGEFSVNATYFDENENIDRGEQSFVVVISPVSGNPEDAYKNELESIRNPERTEAPGDMFTTSGSNGFAVMNIGKLNKGLPAIVSQMTGSVVSDESQINWIYSTTDK